jgi:hypothetical protein
MLKTVTNIVNVSQITGVLPVVNGGTGVTTSTGTGNVVLSAAPTLSGNVALSTGNLVISTSGQGIDFSATPGTGTSELLADYEEGTWTPVDNSLAGLSLINAVGSYTKIGRQVTCLAQLTYPVTVDGNAAGIAGLPFTIGAGNANRSGGVVTISTTALVTRIFPVAGGSAVPFLSPTSAGAVNADCSGAQFNLCIVYSV